MASSSWHQLALHTGCASAAIFAARAAAARAVPAGISDRPRALWYLEHALVNMLLAAMAVPAVAVPTPLTSYLSVSALEVELQRGSSIREFLFLRLRTTLAMCVDRGNGM